MMIWSEAFGALSMALQLRKHCGIAYRQSDGWFIYDIQKPVLSQKDTPEFVILNHGTTFWTIPLTEPALQILLEYRSQNPCV